MSEKKYIITWDYKRNNHCETWQTTVTADNAKAARKAFDTWYDNFWAKCPLRNPPHAFHIIVHPYVGDDVKPQRIRYIW